MAWVQALSDPLEARRRIGEALHGMDGAAISTIHGFCARMLQEFAFESGSRLDVDILVTAKGIASGYPLSAVRPDALVSTSCLSRNACCQCPFPNAFFLR